MPGLWAFLVEVLKSGYGRSVLAVAALWITKPVWLMALRIVRDWVRSAPARHRAALENKVVDQALNAVSKDPGDRAYDMLGLLLKASPPLGAESPADLPGEPVADPPEDRPTDEPGVR
ncbi:hypothetical protein SAMN05444320_10756 [Streptoalloteichus hindustanus]|uniref:Uncharacterized protein n=1 Tax=Streptoalloteichus hindustanus TaxID=2017 RepID=A0A1M5I199_STRHI|nr:hypothetical protein SAMN05444320_10756 [Streptoalloteichus hindustanus]